MKTKSTVVAIAFVDDVNEDRHDSEQVAKDDECKDVATSTSAMADGNKTHCINSSMTD